jgi:phospholipid N-methyltransferase
MACQRPGERDAVIAGEKIVVDLLGNLACRFFLCLIEFKEWNQAVYSSNYLQGWINMNNFRRWATVSFLTCLFLAQGTGFDFRGRGLTSLASAQDSALESKKIVPFVPSPENVVDKMIELAGVKKGDTVYDLGSGDGRIVIAAAKRGARAVGFEIDPDLVAESRANIQKAGVQDLAEIRNQDILTVDLSAASVVTMYLLPDVNLKLRPNLLSQLQPGSRVVSHSFDMGDWKPDKVERVEGRTIYFWTVPAKGR